MTERPVRRPNMAKWHPLHKARHAAGFTQQQLADKSQVSLRCICYTERYNGAPNYGTRRKLLKALGIEWSRHTEIFDSVPPTEYQS